MSFLLVLPVESNIYFLSMFLRVAFLFFNLHVKVNRVVIYLLSGVCFMKILPSLLAANPLFLGATIQLLDPYIDGYHLDVMDGHFVPSVDGGVLWVNAIAGATERPLLVHLMATDPASIVSQLQLRQNKDTVSFHIETKIDALATINFLKKNKTKVSLVINPKTPVANLFPFLGMIDQVLIMAVEPGRSGQNFMPGVLDKVVQVIAERESKNYHFSVALDGGVRAKNIAVIAEHRVDEVVVGSALFAQHDPVAALAELRQRILSSY